MVISLYTYATRKQTAGYRPGNMRGKFRFIGIQNPQRSVSFFLNEMSEEIYRSEEWKNPIKAWVIFRKF